MITKEEIKNWLKKTGRNRQYLAETTGVSKGTVNNWLSGADPIPLLKQQLIVRLISDADKPQAAPAPRGIESYTALAIMMTKAQHSFLLKAARSSGLSIEEFILKSGIEHAETIIGAFTPYHPAQQPFA